MLRERQFGKGIATALIAGLLPGALVAELTVASLFMDHAVLQRDMPVPVWGTADAGTTVTVEFAGQKKSSVADERGKWKVKLEAMPTNAKPQGLVISDTKSRLSLSDLVVGEVWICSGQSNMQMGYGGIPDIKGLIPSVNNLRKFTVKHDVSFEEEDRFKGVWMVQQPDSAVAFSFGYFLEKEAGVPVGIIQTCWGSSWIEGWMPRDMTKTLPYFEKVMRDFDGDAEKQKRISGLLEGPRPWARKDEIFLRTQPNIVYNAMMNPLAPYACRGLVWYQGESNTRSIEAMAQYGETLPAWMTRYRQKWGRDDFHFLVVMLPGYERSLNGKVDEVTAHSWAWMRESQMKALDLPHTGVVNTIDLGDAKDIHPKDKLPIGKRLALMAARDVLGKEIVARGPVLKQVERKGDHLVVHFDHAKGLKTTDGKAPSAFWIADDSAKWVKAEASLSGQSVVLRSADVKKPLYVRYAFVGFPKVNLVNAAGLPAYPFRTDAFKP